MFSIYFIYYLFIFILGKGGGGRGQFCDVVAKVANDLQKKI